MEDPKVLARQLCSVAETFPLTSQHIIMDVNNQNFIQDLKTAYFEATLEENNHLFLLH